MAEQRRHQRRLAQQRHVHDVSSCRSQPDKGANAIHEGENLNPVKTLRLRYDEWRKKQPASFK